MAFNTQTLCIPVEDPAGDDTILLFKAPSNAQGGGIRLLSAHAVNMAATNSGTSFSYALHKYSSAGTPAVNGTISDTIGGTTSAWADGVPKDFTLTAAQTFIDAGEWLALVYAEQGSGNPTRSHIVIQYLLGN